MLTVICLFQAANLYAASCESVAALNLPNVKVTSAAEVAPGAFAPPGPPARGGGPGAAFPSLPTFCRVAATLTPSSDSDIKVEVWLADVGLEWEVPGRRQRRMAGIDWLRGDG